MHIQRVVMLVLMNQTISLDRSIAHTTLLRPLSLVSVSLGTSLTAEEGDQGAFAMLLPRVASSLLGLVPYASTRGTLVLIACFLHPTALVTSVYGDNLGVVSLLSFLSVGTRT